MFILRFPRKYFFIMGPDNYSAVSLWFQQEITDLHLKHASLSYFPHLSVHRLSHLDKTVYFITLVIMPSLLGYKIPTTGKAQSDIYWNKMTRNDNEIHSREEWKNIVFYFIGPRNFTNYYAITDFHNFSTTAQNKVVVAQWVG